MNSLRRWSIGAVLLGTAAAATAQTPVERFLQGIESSATIPLEAKKLIRESWSRCQDCDPAEFLTQGLAVLSPRFREGLDAYSAERHDDCAAVMGELGADENPFIAAHAAAYEIKSLVATDRIVEAARRIDALLAGKPPAEGEIGQYSYFAPEISFLRGYTLLGDLRYEEAVEALEIFLREYPAASQRLTVSAEQILAELRTRRPERIGDVVDLMNFSGRRLKIGDAGESVQTRQQRIIEILDKLIKDEEQKEQSSSGGSGSSGGQSGKQAPSNPMQRSQLPSGGPPEGPLRERRRANPAEMWGAMPPGERERILQALRDNFPSRYRHLVEQYYEELAKKP